MFCLPSGQSDQLETCSLYFLNTIHNAKARIWIASPYFVPDKQIISALQLVTLKVRIIVPEKSDQPAVKLASASWPCCTCQGSTWRPKSPRKHLIKSCKSWSTGAPTECLAKRTSLYSVQKKRRCFSASCFFRKKSRKSCMVMGWGVQFLSCSQII